MELGDGDVGLVDEDEEVAREGGSPGRRPLKWRE